jgi:uncharacterized protein YbaR (Trm112 family)
VDSGQFDINNICCPSCHNNTLVLTGLALLPQREVMEEGIITEQTPGEYKDGSFDLQQIDCLNCNTKFIIRDHELFRMELEISALRKKLAVKEGHPPEGSDYVN